MTPALPDSALQQLEGSAISPETAAAAGVYYVDGARACDLGFNANGYKDHNLAGLVFTYRHPQTHKEVGLRLRPDTPIDASRKYLAPRNSRNHFYMPLVLKEQLADVRFDVLFTEGEKKALALREVVGTHYVIIGVPGVWNWRTSDKKVLALREHDGHETVRENSRPIDDFGFFKWKGRRVYVLFDSDAERKPDVQRAETALVEELRRRGAFPRIVAIPPSASGGKQGIDDWLVNIPKDQRLTQLERLLHTGAPRRQPTRSLDAARLHVSPV